MKEKLKVIVMNKWFLFAVAIIATLTINALFNMNLPMPLPPQEFKVADGTYNMGWTDQPEEVQAIQATLKFRVFSDTPAGAVQEIPDHFYQWEVYRKCDPRGPPCKNQLQVGSCVSFGTNNAILRTMACQIVIGKANEELKDIAEEVTYAGSRVEIGGGRLGRSDGSVGAWAAQFVKQYGVVARARYDTVDLSTYDQARCRAWGSSGVPAALEPVARQHPVAAITQISSWTEAKKALAQGYGIAICSNQGFSMTRDSKGVARPQGSWGHCMCLDGYHVDGIKEYGHIENSWGPDAHKGPVGWGDPSTAGFWADASVIEKMLKQGDSWAFSSVQGFPKRSPDWFVQNRTEPVRLAARVPRLVGGEAVLFGVAP